MASLLVSQLGYDPAWRTAVANADAHVANSPAFVPGPDRRAGRQRVGSREPNQLCIVPIVPPRNAPAKPR